jgi:hypothetical protein
LRPEVHRFPEVTVLVQVLGQQLCAVLHGHRYRLRNRIINHVTAQRRNVAARARPIALVYSITTLLWPSGFVPFRVYRHVYAMRHVRDTSTDSSDNLNRCSSLSCSLQHP